MKTIKKLDKNRGFLDADAYDGGYWKALNDVSELIDERIKFHEKHILKIKQLKK